MSEEMMGCTKFCESHLSLHAKNSENLEFLGHGPESPTHKNKNVSLYKNFFLSFVGCLSDWPAAWMSRDLKKWDGQSGKNTKCMDVKPEFHAARSILELCHSLQFFWFQYVMSQLHAVASIACPK
jgi:hypothetical protein